MKKHLYFQLLCLAVIITSGISIIRSTAKQKQLNCEIEYLNKVITWKKEDWDIIFQTLHNENVPTVVELVKKRCAYWIENGQEF